MSNKMTKTKICAHCGIEKPTSEFRYDRLSKDNLQSWCCSCVHQYKELTKLFGRVRKCRSCGKILPISLFDVRSGEDPNDPNAKYNTHCRQCQKFIDSGQKCSYDEYLEVQTLGSDLDIDGFSQCVFPDDLTKYTDHELLAELKRRGITIEGKLYKTQVLKTELEF